MSLAYDSLRPGEQDLLRRSGLDWDRMSAHRQGTFKLLVRMLGRNGVKITDIPGLKVSFGKSSSADNPKRAINMHFEFTSAAKREFERRLHAADRSNKLRAGRSDKHGALGDKAIYRDVDAEDRNGHDMFGTQIGVGKGRRGFVDMDKYVGNGSGGARKHREYDSPLSKKYKPADPRLVGGLLGIR